MLDEFVRGVREAEERLSSAKEALGAARTKALAEGGTPKTAGAIVDAERKVREAEILLEVRQEALTQARMKQSEAEKNAAAAAFENKRAAYEEHEARLVKHAVFAILGVAEQLETTVRGFIRSVDAGEALADEGNELAETACIAERIAALDENTLRCALAIELRRFFGRPEVEGGSLQEHPDLQRAIARVGTTADLHALEHRLEDLVFEATGALGASAVDWLTPAPDELMSAGTFPERAEAAQALLDAYLPEESEDAAAE